MCTVHFPQQDRRVVVPLDHMEPVVPKQNDKVCFSFHSIFNFRFMFSSSFKIYIIGGESKGSYGDLLSVDNQDGVVQLHGNVSEEITLINLKHLCKCT